MKNTFASIILILSACILLNAQFITLQGNQFKDENGNNFYPISVDYVAKLNYYPSTNTYFIAPIWTYGDKTIDTECLNHNDCIGQIKTDFDNIKAMGFNTVLLVAGPQVSLKNNTLEYFIQMPNLDYYPNWWNYRLENAITTTPVSNYPEIVEMVNGIEEIIDYAKTKDMKVIIDCGINHFEFPTVRAVYLDYLAYIADRLKDKTNILAEDKFGNAVGCS